VERSKDRGGPGQIAFALGDTGFKREGFHIVRCDIENLIKLSQRFGKTTKGAIGRRVLDEQVDVTWVEALGFVEIGLAPIPLTPSPCDVANNSGIRLLLGRSGRAWS